MPQPHTVARHSLRHCNPRGRPGGLHRRILAYPMAPHVLPRCDADSDCFARKFDSVCVCCDEWRVRSPCAEQGLQGVQVGGLLGLDAEES